ncbi:MAG: Prolipoprotein diacylglyceryl transferase [Chloroflexi bacterium ADurb.Bin325]|nr:MAG: Prolipoprotein diacylglyceryl transferase [Chloroflexi bacterium ADurb.Bin325]
MFPVLQIGPLAIQTYPLALLLAGWAALAIAARGAQRQGLDGDHLYNLGLYGFLAGVVAARIGHVITYWSSYRGQLLEIFGFNTQAFLLWPGLAAGLLVAGWYVRRHRLPLARVLDAAAPGVLVGVAIAGVGALLAGRFPGAAADLPWSVDLWGVRRHPSQLYEAAAALVAAAFAARAQRGGARPGAAALIALLGYGLGRWLLEPFRAESAVILGGLRLAQVLGLAASLAALWGLARQRMAHLTPSGSSSPEVSARTSGEGDGG